MCNLDLRITSRKKQIEARQLVKEIYAAYGGDAVRGAQTKTATAIGVNSGIVHWFVIDADEKHGHDARETDRLRWTHITLTGLLMERIKWEHLRTVKGVKLNGEISAEVDQTMELARQIEAKLKSIRHKVNKRM